ncbi:MAG TPA: hypothetical protein VGO62_15750, partial [Myxococcota bacterium]
AMRAFAKNDTAGGVSALVDGLIAATPRPVTHVNVGLVVSAAASAAFLGAAVVMGLRFRRGRRSASS